MTDAGRARPRLVCLLPVRNGARDLPDFLRLHRGLFDAIVALDDGSTDGTGEILSSDPLVTVLLSNPARPDHRGWDDGENRRRLLEAAGSAAPDWILWLDVDERLTPEDATALRTFIDTDAIDGVAYGLKHVRVWGDGFDPNFTWVYRLFAYEPGLELPGAKLHFVPIPTSIPSDRWIRTSLRIQHLGSADEERMRAGRQKYVEADPDGEYPDDFGGLSRVPASTVTWDAFPPPVPVVPLVQEAGTRVVRRGADARVVCLLPVRNGEEHLEGWFESVGRFADAVIALDDGSTDGTRAILERHPLVARVIANPPRATFKGWDDSANRNRLLEAAADLDPDWIVFLDADERMPAEDAAVLRRFIETEARSGYAYLFDVFRMIGDGTSCDPRALSVGRMFAFEPGASLPGEQLHFVPIPTSIPRDRWVRTTIRIQHLAGLDAKRRRARFDKYVECDPDNTHQEDYSHLLAEPTTVVPWEPRSPDLDVVSMFPAASDDGEPDPDAPLLSAIVISRNDEDRIERCLRSVVSQECSFPFEVIVVVSGDDSTARIVRDRFPDVRLVTLPGVALPGRARNAGLRLARGEYISFPGSHVELVPGSLEARGRAHEDGWEMVTGVTLNGTRTPAGWASYFLDHHSSLPGRSSGEFAGPPGHCSYMRHHLDLVGGFPPDRRAGEDTVVNVSLYRRGFRSYFASDVRLIHHSPCTKPRILFAHHHTRGRALGRIMLDEHAARGRLLQRTRFMTSYLPRRIRATTRNVRAWGGDLEPLYRRSFPLVLLGAFAAWLGAYREILRPGRGKLAILLGRGSTRREQRSGAGAPGPGRKTVLRVARVAGGIRRRLTAPFRALRRWVVRAGIDHSWQRLDGLLQRVTVPLDARVDEAIDLLIVGSDSRERVVADGDKRRFGDLPGRRADAIVFVRVDVRGERCSIVSIPRDLLVTADGDETTRIGNLLNRGPAHVVRAVGELLAAPVHHWIEIDMIAFRGLVDAIGGIDIVLTDELYDPALDFWLPAGRVHLNGQEALSFVRSRTAGPTGDLGRIERQHLAARALLRRVATPKVLANPRRLREIARIFASHVVTDDSFNVEAFAGLASTFRRLSPDDVEFSSLPVRAIPGTYGLALAEPSPRQPENQEIRWTTSSS